MTELPIQTVLPEVIAKLEQHNRLVVQAPPGAGKSTLLPLALLETLSQNSGQIWLLEPRRLAAEQVAMRLAQGLNEALGQSIGLMTGERKVMGEDTRLVVMTEAIVSQRLIKENDIPQCSMILFDEFHERNLHTDLGLALALQCQEYLRDDLQLLIMSATLDGDSLGKQLNCPVIESQGRSFDVAIEYHPQNIIQGQYLDQAVKNAVHTALSKSTGDILIFLPGIKEIRQCENTLNTIYDSQIHQQTLKVFPLHGQLTAKQQQSVINEQPIQKIILTTDIAKTSLTLPNVTVVIDSGLERVSQFNLRQGMDELVTIKASKASAIQRAGRAGRVQAGTCYRLYSQEEFQRRRDFSPLAIEQSDLAPFCLSLAAWGNLDLNDYTFLTQPESKQIARSTQLLEQLQILQSNQLTPHGRTLSQTPLHPRLSHMIIKANHMQLGYSACVLAAVLTEGDPLYYQDTNSDLQTRMQLFEQTKLPNFFEGAKVNAAKAQRIIQQVKRLVRTLDIKQGSLHSHQTGLLLMLAFPDRIAQQRGKGYRLRSGMGCQLFHGDSIKPTEYLAVADISQSQQQGQHAQSIIRLCCNIERTEIEGAFAEQIKQVETLQLNEKQQLQIISRQQLGELILSETTKPADASQKNAFYLQEFKQQGLEFLPLNEDHLAILAKLALAHEYFPDHFPDTSETALIKDRDNWLAPFLATTNIKNLDYKQAFMSRLDWPTQQALNQWFPDALTLPTQRQAKIDYNETPPVVRAKLQECFGMSQSPTIAQGKLKLNLHLLSPAQRPLAMTQDLAFFWKEAYPQVRKENRGRYAKHPWPEDPLTAVASGQTKKRMEQK
ncbi:ATP-dependent helicase HrpB [Oceaniserpentilla sp. 4NH20-0058]|uniref:ATP-dependent helicase HrpB n=1 Tax=Oceaniserpentilla sp. 4NH20-0058 TaxID=3127660 RepID=UPI003109CF14